jgi:hypothetical protein
MGTEFSLERQKSFGDIDGESTAMWMYVMPLTVYLKNF